MQGVPEEVQRLLDERRRAREAKDYAQADLLRDRILEAGYAIKDTAEASTVEPLPRFVAVDPASIRDELARPATVDMSVHVLYEGFPADLERFLSGLSENLGPASCEVVVVDNASDDPDGITSLLERFPVARPLHLDRELGWAAARNAGLKTSRGKIIVLADLSVEPLGDICTPLIAALTDPSVAVAGPFGLTTDDMNTWSPTDGPEVHAVEGYLLATRRSLLVQGLLNERFTWYRNADIDLSFQLRAQGGRAVVVPLPVAKHAHRGWEALDDDERARRSKRNYAVFLERWRDRGDLITRG